MKKIKILCALFSLALLFSCAVDYETFTGNIRGKVTDYTTGYALQGVSVTVTPGGASRTTGSDGSFEFNDLEPRQYEIIAQKDNYEPNSKIVTVVTGQDVTGDIQLTPIKKDGALALDVSSLNFGSEQTSLSFSILNKGNKAINWNISGLDKVEWITVRPASGRVEAGKSNAVVVTLNRNLISEYKEGTIIINADNESLPLRVTAEVEVKNSRISLSASTLNFGTTENECTFNITNIGNVDYAKWEITDINVNWISVSPQSGTTARDKSSSVIVTLNRSRLEPGTHTTTILVNSDGESLPLKITAEVEEKISKIEIDTDVLDFGAEQNSLTFNIKNVGNAGNTSWEIKGIEASWLKVNPISGTTAMGKSSAVSVQVDRSGLEVGNYSTSFFVESDGGTFNVTVNVTKTDNRYLEVRPESIDLGTDESATFSVFAHNGSSSYKIYTRGEAGWATFSETEGVLPEYNGYNEKTFTIYANRDGLAPGKYSFTIVIRSEIGDYEIPVSMTVEAAASDIITCDGDLTFSLTSCKISGTTATLELKVKNNGVENSKLTLYGGGGESYAYDDQGNRYTSNNLSLKFSGASETSYNSSTEIPAGITTKFTIKIYNVTSSSAIFKHIEINTSKNAPITLKNIAIEGRTPSSLPTAQTSGSVSSCNDDLKFTLLDCKYGSNYTTIKFRTENVGNESIKLTLYGGGGDSHAYDDEGNKYASNKLTMILTSNSETSYNSTLTIPTGVIANGEIRIYGVAAAATELSNITIKTNQGTDLVMKSVKIRK